ncbi:type I-E CRISPR-associated endonuclease Cas1e [Tessaracoccus sp. OH4464_COT-324]|uniref:type I-E CRISPR-associated endonuclease Cas1e n=1 Tax=Tessaracoccus sp. OH4464_COT-324 TaxID=2491059 RepID=UPI000F639B88|nr:type I-E CRISPR-associated endonuclease Cas1e [Tessaracoccus sp. OH4464_COT-324]RRD45917.1 type I-E CRISPR-associated endonuclease Cas1 [Tessaracoccus sp. OH4464_COT-324]
MIPGAAPPKSKQLLRVEDRATFLHLERCLVNRDSNAITATDKNGVVHIPAATLCTVLLGPGTRITHHAMMLLAQCGVTVVWVGEKGVRYYAHGEPLAKKTALLEAQAKAVSNTRARLAVARKMYEQRFPDEVVEGLTMQQLRGREGARVRSIYRSESARTGVAWGKRSYDPEHFDDSDAINQALSAAHACLYGVVHATVVGLGCSPGLGFIHTGHSRAFVYDIADLYKAEFTIPIAFDVVASGTTDVGADTRRAVRDSMREGRVVEQCVRDVKRLLLPEEEPSYDFNVVYLWDEEVGAVSGGVDYTEVDF